jgi:hypothetical protein
MAFWFQPHTPGRHKHDSETALNAEAVSRPALPLPIVYDDRPIEPAHWEYRCLLIDPEREPIPQEEALNKLGTEGWVLSGVLDQSRSGSRPFIYFYFVRLAQSA